VNKFYIIFLIAIFSSIVLNPLFVIDTTPSHFGVFSQVLAEESDGGDSGDDGGDSDKETTNETDDQNCDKKESTDDETTDEADDEKCDEKETTDDETTDETDDEEAADETDGDETTDDKTTDDETKDATTSGKNNDNNQQSGEENDEALGSTGNGEEYTLLDKIISDQAVAAELLSDESADPEIVSSLLELKQEQAQNGAVSEICDKSAENDLDDYATISNNNCSPDASVSVGATVSTTANSTSISNSEVTNSTTVTNSNTSSTASTVTNTTISSNTISSNTTSPTNATATAPSEICNIGADNSTNSTTDEAGCPPEPEGCSDDVDNNVTNVSCPASQPVVVIESAVDAVGNSLSEGDLIAPQKVTFTFSADANETAENSEQGAQDYKYECALDSESFSPCNSPTTYEMQEGKHDFVVRLVS